MFGLKANGNGIEELIIIYGSTDTWLSPREEKYGLVVAGSQKMVVGSILAENGHSICNRYNS